MTIESIRQRVAAATPGPWDWTGNLRARWVELSTIHSGRLGVMRFDRWGMSGAQPVFLDPASRARGMGAVTNVKASDVPIFEVCPDATSPDDIRVYRHDIRGLRHPDATFIAHARTDVELLLAVAEAAARTVGRLYRENGGYGPTRDDLLAARADLEAALAAVEAGA
jgi:hypothetical protein